MASSAERAQHFLRLQRAALFGAAAAAFASMAVSFELPPWAEALFGAAWILGLAVRERSWPRLQRAATLATAAGILWTLLPALRDRDQLPLAASEAALILCANRLLIRRSAGDDAMLHLSCWMMLAGGAALSGDLLYGASLLGYAILSSVSMTLSELRRGIEEEAPEQAQALLSAPELTSRSLWGFSATLGLFAALFGVCLFPLFPRAQAGLLHGLGGGGRRATGIGDRVDLRAKGELSGSSRLVLRARLTGDLERARYWRVATFESFTGRGWSAGQGPGHAIAGVEAHGSEALVSGSFTLFAASDGRVPAPPGLLELWPEGLEEEDGSAGRRAEAAGPEHFSVRLRQSPAGDLRVFPPVPPELAFRFAAGAPEAEEDGSAGRRAAAEGPERSIERPDPVELARDLQLPELDPEIQRLARRLIPDGASPRDAARSVKRHLGSFRYTRELFGGDQPLGDFLRRKSGHCELFATAAVVLLRARGLPARYVAGYYGGAVRGERLTLREWDAHAWAELYVPGEGFVPLDATPPDLRGGSEERGSLRKDGYQDARRRPVVFAWADLAFPVARMLFVLPVVSSDGGGVR